MEQMQLKFSIVIPCLNEEKYIGNCIDSILNQSYDTSLIEIIVVDGGSTDKTPEILSDYLKKISGLKIFHNSEKVTPRALNIGIKNATGEVVVILGAHTRIDPEFISLNNKFLTERNIKVSGGTQINEKKTFRQKLIGIVMGLPFGISSASYRWSKKEQFVDTVVYAAYKKEIFEEIGYFEEKFSISEDAEINWRIRQKGYKIFYSPQIKTYYYPRTQIIGFLKQLFRYGILRVNVVKKHPDALKFVHLIPSIFVLVILGLAALLPISIVSLKILIFIVCIHVLISLVTSFKYLKSDQFGFLFFIPILIFLMHFFWGLGFLIGFILPKSNKW